MPSKFIFTMQAVLDEVRAGLRLLPAPDNAMESRFRKDDLIILDTLDTTPDRGVYLIDCGELATVRRVRPMHGGFVYLSADDPEIETERRHGAEIADRIGGRVVAALVKVSKDT